MARAYHRFAQKQQAWFLGVVHATCLSVRPLRKRFRACVLRPVPCLSTRLAPCFRQIPFTVLTSNWKTLLRMPAGVCAQRCERRTNGFRPSGYPHDLGRHFFLEFAYPINHQLCESPRTHSRAWFSSGIRSLPRISAPCPVRQYPDWIKSDSHAHSQSEDAPQSVCGPSHGAEDRDAVAVLR
jgi:hypothetical protein